MALITSGSGFLRDLEKTGSLGVYVPLEGGAEGRYQRRARIAGYTLLTMTARGLGDLSSHLMGVHGVRPPHLGKKTIGNDAAVGYVYFIPPVLSYQLQFLPAKSKGLLLWLIEGNVLSSQEIDYLSQLSTIEPKVKVVVELGGERYFRWTPLKAELAIA